MKKICSMTMAASLLTGIWVTAAQAGDAKDADCPPSPGMDGHPPRFGGPPFAGPGGPGRIPPPLLDADLDKDGRITHAEIDRSIRTRFDTADVNHDGTLDEAEFEAARPKPPADLPKPPPGEERHPRFGGPEKMFQRADWNGDGKLSFDEFAAPIRAIATHLDRDADGVITQDEREGPPLGPPPR